MSTIDGRRVVAGVVWLFLVFAAAVEARGQSAAAIVGALRDESGGALAGATVEVASPALIEGQKVVFTSADGRYQVVDLRPGEYTVTFSLAGFQTVRREHIVLSASFTATVDVTLPLGSLEQVVTVQGGAAAIDLRSGTSERPLNQELLEGIPVGRIPNVAVMLIPGAVTARPDVGGSETGQTSGVSIHGAQTRDLVWNTDGLNMTSNTGSGGVSGQYPNQGAYQEVVVQTRALPAEVGAGGVSVNMITKDGGDTLRGELFTTYTDKSLQSDNVSPEQTARGLLAPSATDVFYDVNAGVGGPVVRSKLWFFASARRFRADRFEASTFNPDGSQSLDENLIWNATGKLTWQINPANRVSSFVDYNYKLRNHRRQTTTQYQFVSPEASYYSPLSGPVANVKLTSTLRPNLLIDSGFSWYHVPWSLDYQPDLPADALARVDLSRSTLTGAPPPSMVLAVQERRTWSGVASWLPKWRGDHQFKGGLQFEQAPYGQEFSSRGHGDLVARYRNGMPDSVDGLQHAGDDEHAAVRTRRLRPGCVDDRASPDRQRGRPVRASHRQLRGAVRARRRLRAGPELRGAVARDRLEECRATPVAGFRPHRERAHGPEGQCERVHAASRLAADRSVQPAPSEHRGADVDRRKRRPGAAIE